MTDRVESFTEVYHDQEAQLRMHGPDGSRPAGPSVEENLPFPMRWMQRLEATRQIDWFQQPVHALARALVAGPRRRDVLTGMWLGHAVHPLLTDLPLGAWTSSLLLDVVGGRQSRVASRRLVGIGVVSAIPTAVTGLAEWAQTDNRERRVGLVHALGNTAAISLYAASWVARRQDRHARGVVLGLAGAATSAAAGYLGGHLTLARKFSSRHPAYEEPGLGDTSDSW